MISRSSSFIVWNVMKWLLFHKQELHLGAVSLWHPRKLIANSASEILNVDAVRQRGLQFLMLGKQRVWCWQLKPQGTDVYIDLYVCCPSHYMKYLVSDLILHGQSFPFGRLQRAIITKQICSFILSQLLFNDTVSLSKFPSRLPFPFIFPVFESSFC